MNGAIVIMGLCGILLVALISAFITAWVYVHKAHKRREKREALHRKNRMEAEVKDEYRIETDAWMCPRSRAIREVALCRISRIF